MTSNKRFIAFVCALTALVLTPVIIASSQRILHADVVQLDSGVYHMDITAGSLSGDTTFSPPTDTGTSGYVLESNGSGGTSWVAPLTLLSPADASTNGYLTSTDWSTFNAKVSPARLVTTEAPLSGGGDLSTNRDISISQADASTDGYLSSADWNTFNNRVSPSRQVNTMSPLTGGGDLSANLTIAEPAAAVGTDGYLTAVDWGTFNSKVSATRAISTTAPLQGGGDFSADRTFSMTQAATAANGYLTSTDWNTFNNKQATISVSAPITLSTATVGITQAATAANGYLSSTDWNTFNTKVAATRQISTTAPLTGGGDFSADRTFAITQAATAANGYLSSTDWNTFNGKLTNPATTLGDILYEDATPTLVRLAGNTTTTKKFLTQTGNGTISAVPGWNTIAAGDLPAIGQTTAGVDSGAQTRTASSTNDTAAAGLVGETCVIFTQRGTPTTIAVANSGVNTNIGKNTTGALGNGTTKCSLTAGHWLASGVFCYNPSAAATVSRVHFFVTNTSASEPAVTTFGVPSSSGEVVVSQGFGTTGGNDNCITINAYDINLSGSQDEYFAANVIFSGAAQTVDAYGSVRFIRSR